MRYEIRDLRIQLGAASTRKAMPDVPEDVQEPADWEPFESDAQIEHFFSVSIKFNMLNNCLPNKSSLSFNILG